MQYSSTIMFMIVMLPILGAVGIFAYNYFSDRLILDRPKQGYQIRKKLGKKYVKITNGELYLEYCKNEFALQYLLIKKYYGSNTDTTY